MDLTKARATLAPTGRLRAAINLGNAALAQRDEASGRLGGVTVDLAMALAAELSVELDMVQFNGAGKVSDAVNENVWDIAFLAIDPERAKSLAYSEPYVLIESTYVVPTGSPIRSCDELDRPGNRLVVARNSAYDLYLTKAIKHAELVRGPTPTESFVLYLTSPSDYTAVAGVRESLAAMFQTNPDYRMLPDAIATIEQAMAVAIDRAAAVPFLDQFIRAKKSNGFVRRSLDASGRADLTVAPIRST